MTRARDVANIDGILTATGDTYYASAAATPARLGIGSTGQVMTVAGGVPSWSTPAAGGGITLLSTTNIAAAASTTVTGIDQTYTNLIVLVEGVSQTNSGDGIRIAPNSVQTTYSGVIASQATSSGVLTSTSDISIFNGFGITSSNTNNVFLCEIFNYASTTQFKPMTMVSSAIANSNPQGSWAAGAWRSTSAITSIQLWTYFSFNAAGTIKIFGVK